MKSPENSFEPTAVADKKDEFEFDFNSVPNSNPYENGYQPPKRETDGDTKPGLFGLLGFFVPIVGIILFALWRVDRPQRAKAALTGAIISIVVYVLISIIYAIVVVVSGVLYEPTYYAILPLIALR